MKKSFWLLLVFLLLFQPSVLALTYSGGSTVSSSDWDSYKEYHGLDSTLPLKTPTGLNFNRELWEDLGIIVYGDNSNVPREQNDFKTVTNGYYSNNGTKGEYRFHGLNQEGNKVSNIDFPNDATSSVGIEDRKWWYQPWVTSSPAYGSFSSKSGKISKYNERALLGNTEEEIIIANWINQGLNFNVKQGTINGTNSATSLDPMNYVNVSSPPTTRMSGQGTMFHRSVYTGKTWYQTFPIAKIKEKKRTPVKADIPSDQIKVLNVDANGTVTLSVMVTGELLDDLIFGDPVSESANYHRKDIESWDFELTNNVTNELLTKSGIRKSVKSGYSLFEVAIPKAKYESLLNEQNMYSITFTGTTHVNFASNKRSSDTTTTIREQKGVVLIDDIGTPEVPAEFAGEEVEVRYVPIEFSVSVPKAILDVDTLPVSLSVTNDEQAIDRFISVDGRVLSQLEEDRFLNGQHKFPEIGEDQLYQYRISYIHELSGEEYYYQSYVVVHDSIPRAQVRVEGTPKVNRRMQVTADPSITGEYLKSRSTVQISNFTISTPDNEQIYYGTTNAEYKEFLRKSEGNIIANVTVSNQYGSRNYTQQMFIHQDFEPDIIALIWNNNLARGEQLDVFFEGASLDGDTVVDSHYEIYYDSNKDGVLDQLVDSGVWNGSINYSPLELGDYEIKFDVKESFGEATIAEHVTEADRKTMTVTREFFVDNLTPMTKLYTDIEYSFPMLDVAFLVDEAYPRTENDYIRDNRVDITNKFRVNSMIANVDVWDMHTYVFSQSAHKTRNTGGSYPSSTTSYSSGGYSGTLNRYSVTNNPYTVDQGSWKTQRTYQSFSSSCSNSRTLQADGSWSGSDSSCPSSKYINSGGYSGSIPRTSTSGPYTSNGGKTRTWYANYSGTLSKSSTYWDSNYVTYNDYTGYYSGTVYKDVKQQYLPSYGVETNKYIVYMANAAINNTNDLNYVNDLAKDAKIILIGDPSLSTQTLFNHDHFINYTSDTEALIREIIELIQSENPIRNEIAILINEQFNLSYADIDAEGDPITEVGFQYVHESGYFDNSLGQEIGTETEFSMANPFVTTIKTSFSKPGKYDIYRLIQDDPNAFPELGKNSNLANFQLVAHRKPIAKATLDWDYDALKGIYLTEWVDASYDPDFQYSDLDRGIIDRKIKYRRNLGAWTYEVPVNLEPGNYDLEYVVKDNHGIWSDPFIMNFVLDAAPPVQIVDVKAKAKAIQFSLASIPASEILQLYDVWTRYPYDIYLDVAMYQNGIQKTPTKRVSYSSTTGTKSENDIHWNNIDYTIPSTLLDGAYKLRITAVGQGITNSREFNIQVATPINLKILDFPSMMVSGQNKSYNIKGSTTKYVNDTKVTLHKGSSYATTITLSGTQSGDIKNWLRSYIVPTMPDGNYIAEYTARTPNGNVETKTVQYQNSRNRAAIAGFDISPSPTIYKGDTLQITSTASDPDGDNLTYSYKIRINDSASFVLSEDFIDESGNIYKLLDKEEYIGKWQITQYVSDGKETSQYTDDFYVLDQVIEGWVRHTESWNKNRELYNLSKSGNIYEPRAYHMFFPGEKFLFDSIATETATGINVKIIEYPYYSATLYKQGGVWKGNLWEDTMISKFNKTQELTFIFTATYKNGYINTDRVKIIIDVDPYWRSHTSY